MYKEKNDRQTGAVFIVWNNMGLEVYEWEIQFTLGKTAVEEELKTTVSPH